VLGSAPVIDDPGMSPLETTDAALDAPQQAALTAVGRYALVLEQREELVELAAELLGSLTSLAAPALRRALRGEDTGAVTTARERCLLVEAADLVACASARYAREAHLRDAGFRR
jgi:hypothetical protein